MELYPAIDLVGGRCVRLRKGKLDDLTLYDPDPVGRALRFAEAGATWIHVVDLDRALSTGHDNIDVVGRIVDETPVRVQTGGGLRDARAIESMLDAGVARVVLGTVALTDPALVAEMASRYDGRIVAAVDAVDGEVAVKGWVEGSGLSAVQLAKRLAESGVCALLATEVGRDGMLSGPDIEGLSDLLGVVDIAVLASGGVGSLDDLRSLAQLEVHGRRLAGAVVGKAIYEDLFSVGAAVEAIS